MRNLAFIKHSSGAKSEPRLSILIDKEGFRGYGIYWILMECLANSPNLTASLEIIRILKKQYRLRGEITERILKNYGLFVVKNGKFYSPELKTQVKSRQPSSPSQNASDEDKKDNESNKSPDNAQSTEIKPSKDKNKAKKTEPESNPANTCESTNSATPDTKQEQNARQNGTGCAQNKHATGTQLVPFCKEPPVIINELTSQNKNKTKNKNKDKDSLSKEESEGMMEVDKKLQAVPLSETAKWIALLGEQESWKEAVAMNSGQGTAFLKRFPLLTEKFALFIRLIGEENTIHSLADAQRRFHYWTLKQGKETIRHVCSLAVTEEEESCSPFEQLVDGKRTHDGIPIPDQAPPRPDNASIWNPFENKWEK